jgi:hypothetical protein
MKRRNSGELVQRFRRRDLRDESGALVKQLTEWASHHLKVLKEARPELPAALSDRQQEGCEPLLAIADAAGGDWPQKARKALLEILTGEESEDDSDGVRLLADIRVVFEQAQVNRMPTQELISALCEREPRWSEFSFGKPISAGRLSRFLSAYGIDHSKLRIGERAPWGYSRSAFVDAWSRYLPRKLEQVEQLSNDAAETQFLDVEQTTDVPCAQTERLPVAMRDVPLVPVRQPHTEGRARSRCAVHGADTEWWDRPGGDLVCGKCHPEPKMFADPSARAIGFDRT